MSRMFFWDTLYMPSFFSWCVSEQNNLFVFNWGVMGQSTVNYDSYGISKIVTQINLWLFWCTDANANPRQCTPYTPDICHPNATCTQVTPYVCACNPASSHRCECNEGYIGDGLNCTGDTLALLRTINDNAKKRKTVQKHSKVLFYWFVWQFSVL